MALFIVCAIDVIDWFDFYKFEVSQAGTAFAYKITGDARKEVRSLLARYLFLRVSNSTQRIPAEKKKKVPVRDDVMMNIR